MMQRRLTFLALLVICAPAFSQLRWREGTDYQVISDIQRVGAPADRIEVTEVFSYGCPYCYRARQDVAKLAASLPADAVMTYVPASFIPSENWPMFQRAFYTAQHFGVAKATHEAMFSAVWETGEIPQVDLATGRLRHPLPTIDSAAKFYARLTSVTEAEFLKVAKSPGINDEMKRADALIEHWGVHGTPQLVVNGHYRVSNEVPFAQQAQIVQFLISLERARLPKK